MIIDPPVASTAVRSGCASSRRCGNAAGVIADMKARCQVSIGGSTHFIITHILANITCSDEDLDMGGLEILHHIVVRDEGEYFESDSVTLSESALRQCRKAGVVIRRGIRKVVSKVRSACARTMHTAFRN